MDLGNQIHELRKKYNLSQEKLAEKVGVARQTISKWELGETAPDIKQAQALSQIFDVRLDELFGNDLKASANNTQDHKKKDSNFGKKGIAIGVAVLFFCLAAVGIFSVVNRAHILHPQGSDRTITVSRKESIKIQDGNTDTIAFYENGKPAIACQLPEGFASDAQTLGLYTDESGNFIKLNAAFAENVNNPLWGTQYYSYYEDYGCYSYMEMAKLAMYYDLPKLGIFSPKEELYLAGGAQLMRQQLCAGQNADYYEISCGVTISGDKMHGFALQLEDNTWQITLLDYENNYYFVVIKDPHGVGESIDTVGEFLGSFYAGNAILHSSVADSSALQSAKNAYTSYIIGNGAAILEYLVFQADNTRFVAIKNGTVGGPYSSVEDALKSMFGNVDLSKLVATNVDNLWAYETKD